MNDLTNTQPRYTPRKKTQSSTPNGRKPRTPHSTEETPNTTPTEENPLRYTSQKKTHSNTPHESKPAAFLALTQLIGYPSGPR